MDWSIKSIFRLTHEEELFLLTQNRAKGMLILSLEGCQFQGAQAEFTFNFPPYLSQTAAHFLYHPQPLWWPQSYRTLWKVQDWQQSSPISKQDNWELKKVPSNCTNWCPVWGGETQWAIQGTILRAREKLPACLLQICSVFPWRVQSHQEHF